ncbi:MAG: penicillin-binding protein 2 [Epsilonproteobacteria bacterium]|nr:penicillin-binding protein 2 [Campylobacterota bacterium]
MPNTQHKNAKIPFLFFLLVIGFVIFAVTLLYWARIDRRLPRLYAKDVNNALRGSILSKNGYTVARSKKLYKAVVDTRNINPDKKDIFIKLFSLYSGESIKDIKKSINSYFGTVVLSYKIDAISAQRLRELARKLYRLGVFISYEDKKSGITFLHGLNIVESGEYRVYNYKDILTPVVGYVRKYEKNRITKIYGVKGLEKYYNDILNPVQDGMIKGSKDIAGNIILNGDSEIITRVDGADLHLNISLKLQKIVENMLDSYKKELQAKEIIACVMESKTGKVLMLASSNRYNPSRILKKQYPNLNVTAVEFAYEPGSVLKPVIFSLLLEKKLVNPYDLVKIYGGKYKIGKKIIRDSHNFNWLSAEDVIVHSSNVGISQLAQKLNYIDYYNGLKKFGFTKKSGVDLPYEHRGVMPRLSRLKSEIYKAVTAYGYGIEANFMQLLKIYNIFNNKGRAVSPRIAEYYQDPYGTKRYLGAKTYLQVIPVDVAKRMQKILIKTVQKGTGVAAKIEGLQIGGKTGTSHIVRKRRYTDLYNSSFFGFANDKNHRYTIGVLVREPRKEHHYYASLTAVPVFKSIVEEMIEEGYLLPENITKSP